MSSSYSTVFWLILNLFCLSFIYQKYLFRSIIAKNRLQFLFLTIIRKFLKTKLITEYKEYPNNKENLLKLPKKNGTIAAPIKMRAAIYSK